jgi:DNA-binding transcriptional LysR family regulator
VASGLGVSVVPASVADIRMRDVAYRPIREETPLTPACLATNRTSSSLVLPHFVETVKAAFG